jgi:predicted dehydrogenase
MADVAELRVAVLGCGSIGRRHLRNLAGLGLRDLMAYDPNAEARAAMAAGGEIVPVAAVGEVWEWKPDAVLIAAPTPLHVELALEAARHNCHLFIEKPLSHRLDGLVALEREVGSRGLVTMVGCNMRFHPGPAVVKRLLDEKVVGRVVAARIQTGSYLPRWRLGHNYRESYSASPKWGGAILDCIHEIDLALWYFGAAVVLAAVPVAATPIGLETDGLAEILLSHDSGVLSSVHLNFVQRDYRRTCQVIGTDGTLYWDFEGKEIKLYGADGQPSRVVPEPQGWQINQMYVDELRHFLAAAARRVLSVNPISAGVSALKVALAARAGTVRSQP